MANTRTVVEILDRDLEVAAVIKALYPLNEQGMILRYSKELSDYGECLLRVSTSDPLLEQYGDILVPHKYHIRIRRGTQVVWQGAIIDNPSRNKNYIEVKGAEYLFYFDRVLIKRTSEPTPGAGYHYRIFNTGTMASNIQTIITEAITAFGPNHILSGVTVGTITNPNYPSNFTQVTGVPLTGGWNFSDDVSLQFDYHSVLYVLKAFGIYSSSDFQLTTDLEFNFKPFIGERRHQVSFEYSTRGNIADYDIPRLGKRMANDLTGIGSTLEGTILHVNKRNEDSIQEFGLLQQASAYTDVKDNNNLQVRTSEELRFIDLPESAPINLTLTESAYPFAGLYDIGDIVDVRIKDHVIDYFAARRIVGTTVNLHNTGRELITVQTNDPRGSEES